MDAATLLRLTLGFLLAPACGLAVLAVVWCGLPTDPSFAACWAGGGAVPMVVGLGLILAYPPAIVVGVPLFIAFRKRGWLQWWQVSGGGLLTGLIAFTALAAYAQSLSGALEYVLLCCGVGLASGLAFWLIAVYRNRALTRMRADARKA